MIMIIIAVNMMRMPMMLIIIVAAMSSSLGSLAPGQARYRTLAACGACRRQQSSSPKGTRRRVALVGHDVQHGAQCDPRLDRCSRCRRMPTGVKACAPRPRWQHRASTRAQRCSGCLGHCPAREEHAAAAARGCTCEAAPPRGRRGPRAAARPGECAAWSKRRSSSSGLARA